MIVASVDRMLLVLETEPLNTDAHTSAIVDRLTRIRDRGFDLLKASNVAPLGQRPATPSTPVTDWGSASREERACDGLTAMAFAAFAIGETLAVMGGRDTLAQVYAAFIERHGPNSGVWLDAVWAGIVEPDRSAGTA